jgi:acyl-CoA thioesterase-2
MPEAAELVRLLFQRLDLERLGGDRFAGDPGPGDHRIFGGLVAAQAAVAAGRTVDGRTMNSLHLYFLRGGTYGHAIDFAVERVQEGRSFLRRRVTASQKGEIILTAEASFAEPESDGMTYADAMPAVPLVPEGLPPWRIARTTFAEDDYDFGLLTAVESRVCDDEPFSQPGPDQHSAMWMRVRGPIPEDPLMHAAAIIYASDRAMLSTATDRNGQEIVGRMLASLDHAVWFHGRPRWDGWLLHDMRSPSGFGGRVMVQGVMYSQGGRRMATTTQEGVVRGPRRGTEAPRP